jgi:manganese efflux pump family protein
VALITPPACQPLSAGIEKSFPVSDVTAEDEPAQQIYPAAACLPLITRKICDIILMDTITLLGIALAMAMDAFAVSAAVVASLGGLTVRHVFRLSWHFGLFQFLMPVIGWLLGTGLLPVMRNLAPWAASGLLLFLGARMIWEARHPETRSRHFDPTRGWSLVVLSVATSLDALAVGVTLALVQVSIVKAALVIGVVAAVITFVGTMVGRTAGAYIGQWAERCGGAVLIAIAVNIAVRH